ncbi:MAG: DEAD/DEAH box helicase [Chloroflexi bacterium]|nr:DEAD/DEAH box helicase [Chloroflexota bacterium]
MGLAFEVEDIPGSEPRLDSKGRRVANYGATTIPDLALYSHQAETADLILSGENVLLTSGTASGKTEAACLGILAKNGITAKVPCQVVFLYPTKALANDQWQRLGKYFYGYSTCRFDADNPKRKSEVSCSEIVLTNPQMLIEHLKFSTPFATFLNNIRFLVIDEVHLYSSFQWSLLLSYFNLMRKKGVTPQVILLSATLGNPKHVCEVACSWLKRPFIHVEGKTVAAPARRYRITDQVEDPVTLLKRLIGIYSEDEGSTLVFLPYRSLADSLYNSVGSLNNRRVVRHHGSLGIDERQEAENSLKQGEARVCLTCKTLQQGIDVGKISRVVHVGLPETVAEFWQREGRKGRLPKQKQAESVLMSNGNWDRAILRSSERYQKFISMPTEATALPVRSMAATLFDGFYCAIYDLPLEDETLRVATKLGWLKSSIDFTDYMMGDSLPSRIEPTLNGEKLFQNLSFYGFGRVPLFYEGNVLDEMSYSEAVRAGLPGCILQVDGSPYVVGGWSKYPAVPDPDLKIYLRSPENSAYANIADEIGKGIIFSRVRFDTQAVFVNKLHGAFSEVRLRPDTVNIYRATENKPRKIRWHPVKPVPELPLYTNCFGYEAKVATEEECELAVHVLVHAMREEFSIPLNNYVHIIAADGFDNKILLYESSWGDTHLLLRADRLLACALNLLDAPTDELILPRCNQTFEGEFDKKTITRIMTEMISEMTMESQVRG